MLYQYLLLSCQIIVGGSMEVLFTVSDYGMIFINYLFLHVRMIPYNLQFSVQYAFDGRRYNVI